MAFLVTLLGCSEAPGRTAGRASAAHVDDGACSAPREGCPCAEGARAACGDVLRTEATSITCAVGERTCDAGRFGACDVREVVTRASRDAGAPAVSVLSLGTPTPCVDNPCDPYCMRVADDAEGLDAGAPLTVSDGGITLSIGSPPPQGAYSTLLVTPSLLAVTVTAIPDFGPPVTAPAPAAFQAEYGPPAGTPAVTAARWSLDDTSADLIDESGTLTVLEPVPRTLTVTASAGGFTGTATASVVVDALDAPGVPKVVLDAFADAAAVPTSASTTTLLGEGFDDNAAGWSAGSSAASAPASTTATGTTVTVWSDDFASGNAQGWTIGPSWSIGAATASDCSASGTEDPAADASGAPGGGVAGVVLGGCAPIPSGWSFLVSPVIDASGYSSATLEYGRALDCEDDPSTNCRVDVTPDGVTWYTLFEVRGHGSVHDAAWQPVSHDVSTFMTDRFQVRFGSVAQSGAPPGSGWNLDDVRLRGVVSWSIGPATPSSGEQAGGPDPAVDHAGVPGGGIAGVVRGGDARGALQVNGSSTWFETTGPQFLTSPAIDASGADGTVALSFYRWLNGDGAPYMENVVEVFDGTAWIGLWRSGDAPTPWQPGQSQDSAWRRQSFDLTPYRSAALRVRFGYTTGLDAARAGPLAVSGWNLDDVAITKTTTSGLPADTTRILYPYAGTVLPRGLGPPILQWRSTTPPADYVETCVRFADPAKGFATTFRWCRVAAEPPDARVKLPASVWRALEATAAGHRAEIVLRRRVGGVVRAPIVVPLTIADGPLPGTIYYWEVDHGRVAAITDQGTAVTSFLSTGTDSMGRPRCAACHSVSADGATLVAELDGNGGAGAAFATSTGAPTFVRNYPVGFQAVTPDGAYTLWYDSPAWLSPTTSSSFGPTYLFATRAAEPAFARYVANPAFSPLGNYVAYASRTRQPGYASANIDYDYAELGIARFSAATRSFSQNRILASPPGRAAVGSPGFGAWSVATFPTFSPDEKWVAYELGSALRTRSNVGQLRLVGVDGTGGVELAEADGSSHLEGHDLDVSYQPTFAPTPSGGYHWIVFESQRTYGNTIPRCAGAQKDCGRKQIWVSAVDANPAPGVDPSHPAFWLPAQSELDQNMRASVGKSQCTPIDRGCAFDEQCCGYDPGTPAASTAKCVVAQPAAPPYARTCQAVAANTCQPDGGACAATADCCGAPSVSCILGRCAAPAAPWAAGTFTRDFVAECPAGFRGEWTLLKWRATTAGDSRIDFFVATASSAADLPPAPAPPSAPASPAVFLVSSTSQSGNWGFVSVAAALPSPPGSQALLRLYATLSPSTDRTKAPTLTDWSVDYDCVPSQ